MSRRLQAIGLGALAVLGALTGWAIVSRKGDEGFMARWPRGAFPLRCLVVSAAAPAALLWAQADVNAGLRAYARFADILCDAAR